MRKPAAVDTIVISQSKEEGIGEFGFPSVAAWNDHAALIRKLTKNPATPRPIADPTTYRQNSAQATRSPCSRDTAAIAISSDRSRH